MEKLFSSVQGKQNLPKFLGILILVTICALVALSFVQKTNNTELKFPNLDPSTRTREKLTMASSLTEDFGSQLGDKLAEKILRAETPEEAQFKNPEEFSLFIERQLNQSAGEYETALRNDIAQSVQVHAQIKKNASQKEKESYLKRVRALTDPSRMPEKNSSLTLGEKETFYKNLASQLENTTSPSEYYFIHYELIRSAKMKAIGYEIIAGLDTDPLKAALITKMLADLHDKFTITRQALLNTTS